LYTEINVVQLLPNHASLSSSPVGPSPSESWKMCTRVWLETRVPGTTWLLGTTWQ